MGKVEAPEFYAVVNQPYEYASDSLAFSIIEGKKCQEIRQKSNNRYDSSKRVGRLSETDTRLVVQQIAGVPGSRFEDSC